jgi:cytochrome b
MNQQRQIKVWDPLVRSFHWTLVIAFCIAFATEDEWMDLHVNAGYLIIALLSIRVLWGFIGTRHARFSDFIHPPKVVIDYLRAIANLSAKRHLGHNPAGGAMILALLVMLLLTCLTGIAVYGAEGMGPLDAWLYDVGSFGHEALEEVHEFLANTVLLMVFIHVGGVVVESLLHKENLVRSMFSGYKRT